MDMKRLCPYQLLKRLFKNIKNGIFRLRFRLFRSIYPDEIYYINGSETLPPPLSQEEEEDMIRNIDRPYAKDALIEHNLRLVAFIAKRFENTGANIEELISIGTVGLMKAVSTFNAEKNIKMYRKRNTDVYKKTPDAKTRDIH